MIVGKEMVYFQDPAMDKWTILQSLNQTAQNIREYSSGIEFLFFFLITIVLGILTTYFLSVNNWVMMFIVIIILELFIFGRLSKLRKR